MELQHDWNEVRQRLQGFILRRIDNRQDAEDVLQDVLVKMHQSLCNVELDRQGVVVGFRARCDSSDSYGRE